MASFKCWGESCFNFLCVLLYLNRVQLSSGYFVAGLVCPCRTDYIALLSREPGRRPDDDQTLGW